MLRPVNEYTKPKGLENIGATCYMNSVLQCFYHVKVLTNELLKYETLQNMNMTNAYKDAISQLSSNSPYPAKPLFFKNVISNNPLFRGIQANDSKDLILYFLENIENELTLKNFICNEPKYYNRIKNLRPYNNINLMNIINVFQNVHKSIISDLFYGFMSQVIECNNCHEKLINYQIFNLIIFPIEAVYEFKNQISNSRSNYTSNDDYGSYNFSKPSFYNGYNDFSQKSRYKTTIYDKNIYNRSGTKTVTIYDCFDHEINETDFEGENQIFCNRCRKMTDGKCKNKIFSSPHILILVLNRGKGNQFNCDVKFDEKINISNYVEKNNCPVNYNLIGVISHLGESSMSGHFIADCKHFDGKWYSFSDSSVIGPSYSYSLKGTPYILFYQNNEIS